MIISHKYKVIFVHIPKNAGSFVTHIMKILDPDTEVVFRTMNNALNGHQKISEIGEYLDKYPNYKIFCVVRNIYDRHISFYKYITTTYVHYLYNIVKNMTFIEFTNYLISIKFNDNQSDYIINNRNNLIINIINFDNLKEELINFFKDLNIDNASIQKIKFDIKINPSNKPNSSTTFYNTNNDNDNLLNVQKLYEKDFIYFNNYREYNQYTILKY
jgi:hypothetical protein